MIKFNYFSKNNEGGAISSAGFAEQDCASIIYLFRYLDKEKFKAITFETLDDFTILFEENSELHVQVKNHFLDINYVSRELLEKYNGSTSQVFIGNGFDDDFRRLYFKILKYRYAIDLRDDMKDDLLKDIKSECDKYKIDFDKIKYIQFDSIDKICSVDLALYSIMHWAEKRHLFVDSLMILSELQMKISLILREKRGYLLKKDVEDIIGRHRNSRIASNYYSEMKENDVLYVIKGLEEAIVKYRNLSIDLQLIKYEVENGMYVEALNHIRDLFCYNIISIDETYLWLLYKNKEYSTIIKLNKKDSEFETFILIQSLIFLGEYDEAIYNINLINVCNNEFMKEYLLAICYKCKGDICQSKVYFDKCLALNEHKDIVYFQLGLLFANSKQCIDYMNKSLDINRKFVPAILEKGKVLRYFGKFNKAIKCFEEYMEISKDYLNTDILKELVLSYYSNGELNTTYCSRWIDRFINFDLENPLSDGKIITVIDIGYEYTNILMLKREGNFINLYIGNKKVIGVEYKLHSRSAIGVYIPPINIWMAKFCSEDDQEELKLKASIPALFKIYDSNQDFYKAREMLMNQKVLSLNHEWNDYEEYMVNDDNIEVTLLKSLNSLTATIRIGDYYIDEWIPNPTEGFHNFMIKCKEKTMFNEAAIVLQSPEKLLQITFNKDIIKFDYK